MTAPTPLFIFSLPRAGSTLLQRLLAAHPDIASATEPTFLLPLLHMDEENGVYAAYQHQLAAWAVQDFSAALPGGRPALHQKMAEFAEGLYALAAPAGETYFLDKTPAYSVVVDRILALFPQGKFIFLWRNPLAAAASLMRTFDQGRWNLHLFGVHFHTGLPKLIETYEREQARCTALSYEQLLEKPSETLKDIFEYLELPYKAEVLETFGKVRFTGRLGDPHAELPDYQQLRRQSSNWSDLFHNPLRKAWARQYLDELGEDRLARMGIERSKLLAQLTAQPNRAGGFLQDMYRMTYGALYPWFEFRMLRHKMEARLKGQKPLIHI